MFIAVATTIPDIPNLPGQGGPREEVTLDYSSQNFCATASDPTLTDASPAGGVFSSSPSGLSLNTSNGAIDISTSQAGNYTVTYTVAGVGDSNFPINIGSAVSVSISGDNSACLGFAPSPADLTATSGFSNYQWFKDNNSVQDSSSNVYTPAFDTAGAFTYKVIATDNSLGINCTGTSSDFIFTVNAIPTISIAGGDFCSGSTSTLTATPSTGTFIWELNTGSGYNVIAGQSNNTININTAGDYRAKLTDSNGCVSLYSNVLNIAQAVSPSVTISTVPGATICTGDTATLTANVTGGSGNYTYLWSTGATTSTISVTAAATYTVTVTDTTSTCTDQAPQAITVSSAPTVIANINNDYAMSFNGTDEYVSSNYNSIFDQSVYSFSLWIKNTQNNVNSDKGVLCADASGSRGFALQQNGQKLKWDSNISGGSSQLLDADFFDTTATWIHCVVTYDGSNLKMYKNGQLQETVSSGASNMNANSNNLTIGNNPFTTGRFFSGDIDEVAIWNSSLSSCDVAGIYDATTSVNGQPKSANLLDANTTIPAPVYWNRMGD